MTDEDFDGSFLGNPTRDRIKISVGGSLKDPVSEIDIPNEWITLSGDPHAKDKIRSGMWVILSDGKILKRGYTTGTTSAAACKGAIISLALAPDEEVEQVDVVTPAGISVTLPVKASDGLCRAVKDGGDHQFDITDGIEILARAVASESVELVSGDGIGRFAGEGLYASMGKPAISKSALRQIMNAIEEGLQIAGLKGAIVELIVPRGREIAAHTLNPEIGVTNGISILGSTGFVEPWNDHLAESRSMEIKGLKKVLVTTGRTGLKYSRVLFPDHHAVLIGSHLDKVQFSEEQDSILCGLPALILKWAWPEVLNGTGYRTVMEMVECKPDHPYIERALEKARLRLPFTRIVLMQRNGRILKDSKP